jgi:hypothetical protein
MHPRVHQCIALLQVKITGRHDATVHPSVRVWGGRRSYRPDMPESVRCAHGHTSRGRGTFEGPEQTCHSCLIAELSLVRTQHCTTCHSVISAAVAPGTQYLRPVCDSVGPRSFRSRLIWRTLVAILDLTGRHFPAAALEPLTSSRRNLLSLC